MVLNKPHKKDPFRAEEYELCKTEVRMETSDQELQKLYDRCEAYCLENLTFFGDRQVLREGSSYDGLWLETQPMGGQMYAKRNLTAALNNQLLFMEYQKENGRLPGMLTKDAQGKIKAHYDWFQGFCFPMEAFKMYFLIGHDKEYLSMLYHCLKNFDGYLWKYRDSDGDGCLETWCTWDTGEDHCSRFTEYGAPDGPWGGEKPPVGVGKLPYASMDVMSYSCQAREVLSRISAILGNGEALYWEKQAQAIRQKMREYLWIEEKDACFDRDCNHEFMDILLHNNLRCMYFGAFDQDMAERFVRRHLFSKEEFFTPVPLPSIAANDPMFRNVNQNNWSGQCQGLTYQRAIAALEQYGFMTQVRILGKKWIGLLKEKKSLVQQYDPFDGTPCVGGNGKPAKEGYGPTILAALEYIALLGGIRVEEDRVSFSCVRGWPEGSYQQEICGKRYELRWKKERMYAYVDDKWIFDCDTGVSVTTDLEGRLLWLWGIEEEPVHIRLKYGKKEFCGSLEPNEQVKAEQLIV